MLLSKFINHLIGLFILIISVFAISLLLNTSKKHSNYFYGGKTFLFTIKSQTYNKESNELIFKQLKSRKKGKIKKYDIKKFQDRSMLGYFYNPNLNTIKKYYSPKLDDLNKRIQSFLLKKNTNLKF